MKRTRAAAIANDALRICRVGQYTNLLGETIDIADDIRRAVDGTIEYPPRSVAPRRASATHDTQVEVTEETTLQAAERLHRDGHRIVALNFASAKNPGGGFLNGARAQEESLCRSSALYACLEGRSMYAAHRSERGGFYTNYAIYSPDVPVFFTDAGIPLPRPYPCSFVTAPAVNAGVYLDGCEERIDEVRAEMVRRVEKVLAVMAAHAHETIILGAWGCGVFRNDPRMIAELFGETLTTAFAGAFSRVVFAVWDETPDGRIRTPFVERFGVAGEG